MSWWCQWQLLPQLQFFFSLPPSSFGSADYEKKAWKLWTEGKALELVDPIIEHSFSVPEVLRCIQVGLLCVQQSPGDRPTMSMVVSMLDSDSEVLQQPKQPGFVAESTASETEISSSRREFLANKLTSTLQAR
ncbi:hypothetical protein RJ639_036593 [Escallonia herrerae]|uniref:S-locus receptor kinase C-terminal domain-containing protein n=1 Tax=Escallonia herrerae TaxID=1293975 RepID=A0AA88WWX6_9ASTE|nr:hypothetical protein RJ639_036593 [Escallonia herrerae]